MLDNGVQALHELGDRGGEVPPVHIQDIDIVRLQLVQRVSDRDMERFAAVAGGIAMDDIVVTFVAAEASGVFGSDDHFVTDARVFMQPFANPHFGLLGLVVVGGIDEVAALAVKVVEQLEYRLLRHCSQEATPVIIFLAKDSTHGSEIGLPSSIQYLEQASIVKWKLRTSSSWQGFSG